MKRTEKKFSVVPVGTRLYKMLNGKLVEFEINSISIKVDAHDENYILYGAYTNAVSGVHRFVQPLEGKFEKANAINGNARIDTLYDTKEECVEAFLKELGVHAKLEIEVG